MAYSGGTNLKFYRVFAYPVGPDLEFHRILAQHQREVSGDICFPLALPAKKEVDQNLVLFRVARTQGTHLLRCVPSVLARHCLHDVDHANSWRCLVCLPDANTAAFTFARLRSILMLPPTVVTSKLQSSILKWGQIGPTSNLKAGASGGPNVNSLLTNPKS